MNNGVCNLTFPENQLGSIWKPLNRLSWGKALALIFVKSLPRINQNTLETIIKWKVFIWDRRNCNSRITDPGEAQIVSLATGEGLRVFMRKREGDEVSRVKEEFIGAWRGRVRFRSPGRGLDSCFVDWLAIRSQQSPFSSALANRILSFFLTSYSVSRLVQFGKSRR